MRCAPGHAPGRSLRQLKKEVRERLQDPEAASGMASGASSQDGAAAGAEAAAAGDEARPGFPTPWATVTALKLACSRL
jgi:hypothetical protein